MSASKTEIAAREAFDREIAQHEMQVIRDDGLYRHLRFKRPDTGIYWFDLLTWPGHLCITGDASDGLVFARTEDMFAFFHGNSSADYRINPKYWAEKLQIPGRSRAVEAYAEDLYVTKVREWIAEHAEEMEPDEAAEFRSEAEGDLLDDEVVGHEETAREALDLFTHKGLRVHETWEWNLKDWDYHYLWSCHAIVWGIEKYRAAECPVCGGRPCKGSGHGGPPTVAGPRPSREDIERAMTPAGGWTRKQLAAWGVPWPPPPGWRGELEAKVAGDA